MYAILNILSFNFVLAIFFIFLLISKHHTKPHVPKRLFGKFKCPLCSNEWNSANAWEGMKQQCRRCPGETQAYDLQPLKRKEEDSDDESETKPHRQDLCEMCQKLGHNCRDYNSQDLADVLESLKI